MNTSVSSLKKNVLSNPFIFCILLFVFELTISFSAFYNSSIYQSNVNEITSFLFSAAFISILIRLLTVYLLFGIFLFLTNFLFGVQKNIKTFRSVLADFFFCLFAYFFFVIQKFPEVSFTKSKSEKISLGENSDKPNIIFISIDFLKDDANSWVNIKSYYTIFSNLANRMLQEKQYLNLRSKNFFFKKNSLSSTLPTQDLIHLAQIDISTYQWILFIVQMKL